jgi:hypothetical protein
MTINPSSGKALRKGRVNSWNDPRACGAAASLVRLTLSDISGPGRASVKLLYSTDLPRADAHDARTNVSHARD